MRRARKKLLARRRLNNFAGIHDGDAMGVLRHHRQIMCDQEHGHTARTLQFTQQFKYLRLYRHIQRSSRFIGDQQFRITGQCDRNHDALFHAAR